MGHRNIAVTLTYYAEYINDDLLEAAGADRPVSTKLKSTDYVVPPGPGLAVEIELIDVLGRWGDLLSDTRDRRSRHLQLLPRFPQPAEISQCQADHRIGGSLSPNVFQLPFPPAPDGLVDNAAR